MILFYYYFEHHRLITQITNILNKLNAHPSVKIIFCVFVEISTSEDVIGRFS